MVLEKMVFFSILTWILFKTIMNPAVNKYAFVNVILLGFFMLSVTISAKNFGNLTDFIINRYQVLGFQKLSSFLERNRKYVGYFIVGIVNLVLLFVLWIYFEPKLVIPSFVIEIVIALFLKSKKINTYFRSKIGKR